MSWKKPLETLAAALIAAASPSAASEATDLPRIPFLIQDRGSAIDAGPLGELLIRLGAPLVVVPLPSGRIRSEIEQPVPACGASLIRNFPNRETLQWIAKTATFDMVLAGRPEASLPIEPGQMTVVALNTLAHDIALREGYEVLPVKSVDQIASLLTSGRATFWLAPAPEVERLMQAAHLPLKIIKHVVSGATWLACNQTVTPAQVEAITRAWNTAEESGELRKFYARAGLLSLYPER